MRAARALHLTKRFAGSLWPGGPSAAGESWARAQLLGGEEGLWRRMSGADRRHALSVARRVERALGHEATRPVLAAALMHDVGKLDSRLGTLRRVVATLAGAVARPDWEQRRGFRRRVALYRKHGPLGAGMLELAGSDALTVTWAREHHTPPDVWSLPTVVAHTLKEADDD